MSKTTKDLRQNNTAPERPERTPWFRFALTAAVVGTVLIMALPVVRELDLPTFSPRPSRSPAPSPAGLLATAAAQAPILTDHYIRYLIADSDENGTGVWFYSGFGDPTLFGGSVGDRYIDAGGAGGSASKGLLGEHRRQYRKLGAAL